MAFRQQQQRPRSSRHVSYPAPQSTAEATATASSQLPKQPLEASEEWVLFSPAAPSTTARTHTTTTERTAGLSRFSEFGSLDTAARSDQHGDEGTLLDTEEEEEEELDSLDDGLRAFHEPSEYGVSASRLQESDQTVLPTHDGLGTFQPDVTIQENIWQFERHSPRRRLGRRRSSVQRHLTALDETDELNQEQERRQRIEKWRFEQSRALLEEIEKETRRRRRMSTVSAARSRTGAAQPGNKNIAPPAVQAVLDAQNESSDEGTENLSIWQRITRRVIRDIIGLDEDTLSVIFGEALPEEAVTPKPGSPVILPADSGLHSSSQELAAFPDETWQTRLLERVAQELGTLVHQLSEHPGAFSTYQRVQSTPAYAGLIANPTIIADVASLRPTSSQKSVPPPASAQRTATAPTHQTSHVYSDASLWGIEEEAEVDPQDSLRVPDASTANATEDVAREQEYWERELDIKMIFNFLISRFTSRRPSVSSQSRRTSSATVSAIGTDENESSARRAAIIRQNHPLVNRTTGSGPPTSSSSSNIREARRKDVTYRTYFNPQTHTRQQKLRSSSSCASQSTKKSKRSAGSNRNYWDLGGSVGSGSIFPGEA